MIQHDSSDHEDAPADHGYEGRLDGLTILIVDDERDILESFRMALEAEGADTITALDGNTGVDLCLEHEPDLVVLDMMLPGRSGFLVLEKIKGRDDSPHVIMVTANEGRRHHDYADNMGVDAYLLKPVPLSQLIDTIERLCGDRSRPASED